MKTSTNLNTTNALIKLENFTSSTPFIGRNGQDAEFYVYTDEGTLEIYVDFTWDSNKDDIDFEASVIEYLDEDDKELDHSNLDLDYLVIKVFEKDNLFGEVESRMIQSYHEDHRD